MSVSSRLTTRLAIGAAAVALIAVPTAAHAVGTAAPKATVSHTAAKPAVKPTVVLVHGAWADASSFAPVTERLQRDGYTVLNAPNPLRGLSKDAASVEAFVQQATTGPVVLVGHSYGGSVITDAASSLPQVKALVYVDAFAPDKGESIQGLAKGSGSVFDIPDQSKIVSPVLDPNTVFAPGTTAPQNVDLYFKRDLFRSAFAAHLPASEASVLAASQSPIVAAALGEPLSVDPAWKTIPSWFVIGTEDKVIPEAAQKQLAARAHGKTVTVKADHLSMLEQPTAITRTIENAAGNCKK